MYRFSSKQPRIGLHPYRGRTLTTNATPSRGSKFGCEAVEPAIRQSRRGRSTTEPLSCRWMVYSPWSLCQAIHSESRDHYCPSRGNLRTTRALEQPNQNSPRRFLDDVNAISHRGAKEIWLRGLDLNQRPSGYEPDELPGCSTPRDENTWDINSLQIEKPFHLDETHLFFAASRLR